MPPLPAPAAFSWKPKEVSAETIQRVGNASQVVVADGHTKILQGSLLIAEAEDRVRYGKEECLLFYAGKRHG
jgi:hypothetical protein